MSATRKPVEPTEQQLLLALRQLRRPEWPQSLEACLAHVIAGPCIRGLAGNLARATPTPGRSVLRRPAVLPDPPPAPAGVPARKRYPGPTFDARRAAANDLDDDHND